MEWVSWGEVGDGVLIRSSSRSELLDLVCDFEWSDRLDSTMVGWEEGRDGVVNELAKVVVSSLTTIFACSIFQIFLIWIRYFWFGSLNSLSVSKPISFWRVLLWTTQFKMKWSSYHHSSSRSIRPVLPDYVVVWDNKCLFLAKRGCFFLFFIYELVESKSNKMIWRFVPPRLSWSFGKNSSRPSDFHWSWASCFHLKHWIMVRFGIGRLII